MKYHFFNSIGRNSFFRLQTLIYLAVMFGAASAETSINKDENNIAISGYDTVAYFTEERAVKGRSEIDYVWQNTRWFFSNETNRELFASSPENFAPQFGGYCAGAMTRGIEVKADPEAWTIVDGKLFIKVNKEARDDWRKDSAENIENANKSWEEKRKND